jgi:GT2 family glycosyltransferase
MKSIHKKVNIIIPVYDDWSSLKQNLVSVKKHYTNSDHAEVYYVNDCGPQADILEEKIISAINGIKNFHYERNDKNLGFIKSCNNAVFKIVKNKKADILLLNSDTVVTKGFAEEMVRILYSQDDLCAVNPRSNNATVWSVPTDSSLMNKPRKSYRLWKKLKEQIPDKYISPTAHGFCMIIRRDVIDKIGLFDEIYGCGYGEENDFTMRARKAGFKCAAANHVFVFHQGSKSFGNERRSELVRVNSKTLLKRYPEYNELVAQYVSEHYEPKIIRSHSFAYKLFKAFVGFVDYGHVNGYNNAYSKVTSIINNRFFTKKSSVADPKIQVWSHEITKSGAPLVLFDIIQQWRKEDSFPTNINFNFPYGARVDSTLLSELDVDGIHFNEVRMLETHFNNGDIVFINSSGQPYWLYEKVITQLQNGVIKHLYFYIHEDDERTTGATEPYKEDFRLLLNQDKITIYAPSDKSTYNWKKHFNINKNILPMPGHVSFQEKMFKQKSEKDFDNIKFVIAGSREVRKGILNVLHALQTVEKYHIQKQPDKYRNFTLTIVGDDHKYDFHNRFIQNEARYFNERVKLLGNTPHNKLYDILNNSNFTITYSIADSLSMATFEGMAFGHPIIRSESSGLKEQLITGKNGWLVHTSNWGELVDAIEEVLNKDKTSNKKLSQMSHESIKIAENNHISRYVILDDLKRVSM